MKKAVATCQIEQRATSEQDSRLIIKIRLIVNAVIMIIRNTELGPLGVVIGDKDS
jgi:hypothetical protein